jgi:L,D-transpeptidase ErfK/SrfK
MGKRSLLNLAGGCLGLLALLVGSVGLVQSPALADSPTRKALPDLTAAIAPELPVLDATSMLVEDISEVKIVVRLGVRRVFVYQGEEVKASYPVAVGKPGWETPKGNFKVLNMEKNPAWKNPWTGDVIKPGPGNPMGERAIDFWTNGKIFAAFHGTPGESLIGQAVSHGCVRMRNADIRAMYDMISMGTPVIVEP